MEKTLYFQLSTLEGEGGTMELSGCLEWIKGDMEANYPDAQYIPEDDRPQYTLTPVWYTDAEYEALPDQ